MQADNRSSGVLLIFAYNGPGLEGVVDVTRSATMNSAHFLDVGKETQNPYRGGRDYFLFCETGDMSFFILVLYRHYNALTVKQTTVLSCQLCLKQHEFPTRNNATLSR